MYDTLRTLISHGRRSPSVQQGERPIRIDDDAQAATEVIGGLATPAKPFRFVDAYLVGANFKSATSLRGADFRNSKLWASDFSGAQMKCAVLNGAAMSDWESFGWKDGAWDRRLADARSGNDKHTLPWKDERFRYVVNFTESDLTEAQIENTSVSGAIFWRAKLNGTSFRNTDLSRADFEGAKDINEAHFEGACYGASEDKPIALPNTILAKLQSPCPGHGDGNKGTPSFPCPRS